MKPYPIVKVTLPSDLKGCKSGEIPAALLRSIEGKGKLHHLAADAYEAMDAAANKEGIDLATVLAAEPTSEQATQLATSVEVLAVVTEEQAEQIFEAVVSEEGYGTDGCARHQQPQLGHRH